MKSALDWVADCRAIAGRANWICMTSCNALTLGRLGKYTGPFFCVDLCTPSFVKANNICTDEYFRRTFDACEDDDFTNL